MTVTFGSSQDFVPSSFMAFDQVVAKAVSDLAARPKPLAQVAKEYRDEERAKAQITFVQDGRGQVVKASN
jgi:hypothetical protein